MTTRSELQAKTINDLRDIAGVVGIETDGLQKAKLIDAIMGANGFEGAVGAPPVDLPEAVTTTAKKSEHETEDSETATDLTASDSKPESDVSSEEDAGAAIETSDPDTSGSGQADEMRSKGGGSGGQSRNQSRDQSGDRDGNRNRNRNRNRRGRGSGGNREQNVPDGPLEDRQGILDILPEGYGFLRW